MNAPLPDPLPSKDEPAGLGEIPLLLFIRGLAFVVVMVGLTLGLHYYLGVRLIRGARMPEPLAKGVDGFKIVQTTAIHSGETLGKAFLERVVPQVNALQPDLVAVTGDVIDGSVKSLRGEVEPLSRLAGKHGNFYVTGNHEYYH